MRIPFVLLICMFAGMCHCLAQTGNADTLNDFISREKVIFQDDFSNSITDTFPSRWCIKPCDAMYYTTGKFCHINKEGAEHALVIKADSLAYESTIDNLLEPHMMSADYLPDSFTLEYDFLPGSAKAEQVLYFHYEKRCNLIAFSISNKDYIGWVLEATNFSKSYVATLPESFQYNVRHHFALSFYKGIIKCYIDNRKTLVIPNCGYDPHGFMLSADGKDFVAYSNVRVAGGPYMAKAKANTTPKAR